MRCPSCSTDVADGRRFCTSCGTPLAVSVGAAARTTAFGESPAATLTGRAPMAGASAPGGTFAGSAPETAAMPAVPAAPAASQPDPAYDAPPATAAAPPRDAARPDASATQVLADAPAAERRPGWRARLAPAGDAVRRRADDLAGRYRTAPRDVRLALVGTVVTVASFLLLPYAEGDGAAAEIGGRLWWRPLTAVIATALLATTLRARGGSDGATGQHPGAATDRLLAALVVATVGATEAGLVGIVSGATSDARIGFYGMLAGLVVVLFATVRAARRRCGAPTAS